MNDNWVRFVIYGPPRGKARPRVTRHGTYTPKTTRDYQAAIRAAYRTFCNARYFERPVHVTIYAFFKMPKSMKAAERKNVESGKYVSYPHKPDADNIAKAVMDALNGLAWKDDAAVVGLSVIKGYVAKDPCTIVRIVEDEQ